MVSYKAEFYFNAKFYERTSSAKIVYIYISIFYFMEENKHVTIYDIAERLNLATSTISRALKDHHTIR